MQSMDAGSRRQGCGEQTAGHTRVYVCIHTRVYVCTYVSIQPGGTDHTLFFLYLSATKMVPLPSKVTSVDPFGCVPNVCLICA
jgi:hypothetical protein